MRLGKIQASGYVADVAAEEVSTEPQTQTPEPVTASRETEREQVIVQG